MAVIEFRLPAPKMEGVGHVLYRCRECGGLGEPDTFRIDEEGSRHLDPGDCIYREMTIDGR